MKTKDVPAIVMLLAGGVYCLFGILYWIPLMDFMVQLLIVLLVFWMIGGIARAVLDKFMGEIEVKTEEEEEKEDTEESEEGSEEKKESDSEESKEEESSEEDEES